MQKTVEEILKKHHVLPKNGTAPERLIAAMKEYAALTSPASGWVKIESEKDLPEGERLYEYEYDLINERTRHKMHAGPAFKESIRAGIIINVYYLSETPLPTVEECMSKAGILSSRQSATAYTFRNDKLRELIQYAKTGLKQL